MKISYGILTHNEGAYIERLLSFLVSHKREEDEIVVVDDYSEDVLTKAILEEYEADAHIKLYKHSLENHFGNQKNFLNSVCSGDFIFQIDADELPSEYLMKRIHDILLENIEIDVYFLPRINVVNGLTEEHVKQWNWKVNDKGWVNFPDWQARIYKNSKKIQWVNAVHETLEGFATYSAFPEIESYCLYHEKEISRQEQQNTYYNSI